MRTNRHISIAFRIDFFTKAVLSAIALFLGMLALRPAVTPSPVHAQSAAPNLYIEPGTVTLRELNGNLRGDGKVVVDLVSGEIWGFPTLLNGAVYPIDVSSKQPPVSKPIYLGRFDFSAMKRSNPGN